MTLATHEPAPVVHEGGLVPVLSPDEAQALTERIAALMDQMHPLLFKAWREQAWRALGYSTWSAYCKAEFRTDRLKLPREDAVAIAAAWHDAGASNGEIGAACGVTEGAVRAWLGRDEAATREGRLQQSRRSKPLTERLLAAITAAGPDGLTVKEVTRRFHVHHGQASPALHALHASHRVAHLAEERRNGCRPYVAHEHVQGRPVRVLHDRSAE